MRESPASSASGSRPGLDVSVESPRLPEHVARVLALLDASSTTVGDLADVFESDDRLARQVVALVNSRLYGMSRITTVRHAVIVLGFGGVRGVALLTGLGALLRQGLPRHGHDRDGLLLHSVAVAAAARALGKTAGLDAGQRECLFVGGLLHDIGKIATHAKLELATAAPSPVYGPAAERAVIGIDHAAAGAAICRSWGLVRSIVDLVASHHEGMPGHELRAAVAILRLSDALVHERAVGYSDRLAPEPDFRDRDRDLAGLGGQRWGRAREAAEVAIDHALASVDSI